MHSGDRGRKSAGMYKPIENYGLIGDLNTTALIGMDGSIDFMCFPQFDSPTIFAALLDSKRGGSFQLHPGIKARSRNSFTCRIPTCC